MIAYSKKGKPNYCDSYYLQRAYIVDKFSQVLELSVSLPQTMNHLDAIENLIFRLVAKNDLLRTVIDTEYNLCVYPPYSPKVPVINSPILNNLHEHIVSKLRTKTFDQLLWEVYLVEDKHELHFFINHLICDQASLSVIEKDIVKIVQGNCQVHIIV